MEASARVLYTSLSKFRALADHLQVWPGHGAGSACGKALGAVPFSTIGYEKLANWALNVGNENAFVREVLSGQPDPPSYFARMKQINRDGPRVLRGLTIPAKLPPTSIHDLMEKRALVLDTRKATTFAEAHVPGTINIPYNKNFSNWAGWLIPPETDITLIVNATDHELNPHNLASAVRDLATVGIDRVTGWMDQGALHAWTEAGNELERTERVTTPELVGELNAVASSDVQRPLVIDVRNADEWSHGHIDGAQHIPLGHLGEYVHSLPEGPIVVHCQSGGRSAIAASLLLAAGRTDVRNLAGGIKGWVENNQPVEHE
jgi:hydroxyacylglutathione hydrolase